MHDRPATSRLVKLLLRSHTKRTERPRSKARPFLIAGKRSVQRRFLKLPRRERSLGSFISADNDLCDIMQQSATCRMIDERQRSCQKLMHRIGSVRRDHHGVVATAIGSLDVEGHRTAFLLAAGTAIRVPRERRRPCTALASEPPIRHNNPQLKFPILTEVITIVPIP